MLLYCEIPAVILLICDLQIGLNPLLLWDRFLLFQPTWSQCFFSLSKSIISPFFRYVVHVEWSVCVCSNLMTSQENLDKVYVTFGVREVEFCQEKVCVYACVHAHEVIVLLSVWYVNALWVYCLIDHPVVCKLLYLCCISIPITRFRANLDCVDRLRVRKVK